MKHTGQLIISLIGRQESPRPEARLSSRCIVLSYTLFRIQISYHVISIRLKSSGLKYQKWRQLIRKIDFSCNHPEMKKKHLHLHLPRRRTRLLVTRIRQSTYLHLIKLWSFSILSVLGFEAFSWAGRDVCFALFSAELSKLHTHFHISRKLSLRRPPTLFVVSPFLRQGVKLGYDGE